MKTQYQLIAQAIKAFESGILRCPRSEIQKEYNKMDICKKCPDTGSRCWSCGVYTWWNIENN